MLACFLVASTSNGIRNRWVPHSDWYGPTLSISHLVEEETMPITQIERV